jgi:ubiquitin-protein ligase E3 A
VQLSYETFFGEKKTFDLKEGGEALPVTAANREEYVALYVEFMLQKAVAKQYGAFKKGFLQVSLAIEPSEGGVH